MPEHKTEHVSLEQDLHHPTQDTTNERDQIVIVPQGNKLVQLEGGHWYRWEEASQNHCRGEKFEIYYSPHFPTIPIGIKISATLTSGPIYDKFRGWLSGNLTIAYGPITIG
jgi:hypothetical protein